MTIDHTEYCRVERDEGLLVITLDRPEVLNALHLAAHVELSRIFDSFAVDPALRVAIVTGSGERAFCVGTDLKSLAATGNYSYPRGGFAKRFDLWKPVIAAVNGLCLGGGFEILAACDLAVASEHAQFGLPEPLVGLAALGGSALQRLARQISMKDAMYLALTGQRVDAAEARRIGLVTEVVPQAEVMARARTLAQKILACAPLALQATKQAMLMSFNESNLEKSMQKPYPAEAVMLASRDAIEGPLAFAQKRKPDWMGV